MKKLFLFLMACCLSLTMSAKVAYLVPGNSTSKDVIPNQWDGHTFEKTAYDWFETEYANKGMGGFINLTSIPTDTNEYAAIWIYVDREWKQQDEPWNEERMDALFDDNVVTALSNYVKAGGNLFLGKQAARLAYRMGRIGYAPNYECGGYSQDNRFWGIKAKLGSSLSDANNQRDRSSHAIYSGLATATMDGVEGCFPLLNAQGDAHSTNNNIHWVEYWTPNGEGGWHKNPDNNGDPDLIDGWETYWKAKALGTWTNIGDYCIIQAVEFFPKDDFKGTILTMNIGAYQWNSESTGDASDNVKKLTANALRYLNAPSKAQFNEDYLTTGRDKYDNSLFMELYGDFRQLDTVSFVTKFDGIAEADRAEVTKVVKDGKTRLVFTKAGQVDLEVNLHAAANNAYYPEGDYTLTQHITFAFDSTAPSRKDLHIDDDFYENGREGGVATGDFMVLHPSLRGTSATYTVTNGTGVAQVENGLRERDRMVFTQAGTATLHVAAQQVENITAWPCGTYNFDKEITFAFDKAAGRPDSVTIPSSMRPNEKKELPETSDDATVVYTITAGNENAEIVDGHFLNGKAAGKATVAASYVEDNYVTTWPKGTYTLGSQEVTLAYTRTYPKVIEDNLNEDFPTDGTFNGGFTLLHPNVRGYNVTYELKTAEDSAKTFVNAENRLVFIEPATVILLIKGTETQTDQEWPAGPFVIEDTLTFTGEAWPEEVDYTGHAYTRTVTPGNYGTLCLPYPATVSGATLYTIHSRYGEDYDLRFITLEETGSNVVEAGKAYIFLPTVDQITATATGVSVATADWSNSGAGKSHQGLFGSFYERPVDDNGVCYLISNNELRLVTSGANTDHTVAAIRPFRAYIAGDCITDGSAAPAPTRATVILGKHGVATGVENVADVKAAKALVNGKMVIVRGNKVYGINGVVLK